MPTIRSHKFNSLDFSNIVAQFGLPAKKYNHTSTQIYVDGYTDDKVHWGSIIAIFDIESSNIELYDIEPFNEYILHTDKNVFLSKNRKFINYNKPIAPQLANHIKTFLENKNLYKKLIRFKELEQL